MSLTTKDGAPKIPNVFRYEGKIIFISNLSYPNEVDSAIDSRLEGMNLFFDMKLTPTQIVLRMKALIEKQALGSASVPQHIKYEILEALISYMDDKTIDAYKLSINEFLACEQKWLRFPDMDLKKELKFTIVPT